MHWLNQHTRDQHGNDFLSITPAEQTQILETLAYRRHHTSDNDEGQKFFAKLREYTLMGYYTTRIGLEQLDYPGFRSYSSSPGCTHHDDPAHVNAHPEA